MKITFKFIASSFILPSSFFHYTYFFRKKIKLSRETLFFPYNVIVGRF